MLPTGENAGVISEKTRVYEGEQGGNNEQGTGKDL